MTGPQAPPKRTRRRTRIIAAVAVLAVVVATVVVVQRANAQAAVEEQARALTERFGAAWANDDFAGIAFADATDADVTADYYRLTDGLGEFAVTVQPRATVITEDRAVGSYIVDWTLGEDMVWTTDARIEMVRRGDAWLVEWAPTIIHPDLTADTRLVTERVLPRRGQIYGTGDQVLVTDRAVVEVGVQPSRIQDLPALAATLESLLGIRAADLITRVQGAKPDAFVAVITLRRTDYDPIREQLQPLPGTMFREKELPLGPSRNFARALLGTSGEVTAEVVEASDGRYRPGDVGGLSGLQARYDAVLAGEPGVNVYITNAPPPGEEPAPTSPDPGADGASTPDDVSPDQTLQLDLVFEAPPIDGSNVRTTIDPKVQFAAEGALEAVEAPSSIVAIKPSTGEIVAVANGPAGGDENLAFTGQYPPGSTFKVVATEALLNNRLSTGETVDCSAEVAVGGRTFRNAEFAATGKVSFKEAFASSCNTAFVRLSERLDADALTQAGARFGLGGSWNVGVPAYTGSVPATESGVDKAAAVLGQGKVLVSPLAMAMVAATVADGTWRPPKLVTEPAGLGPGASPAADGGGEASTTSTTAPASSSNEPVPLPGGEVNTLQSLMRDAVAEGTGWRAALVEPQISGKTGTAEFGTEDPPKSHAWFIGYQGDLAFVVFVDSGEFGGETAVPLAVDFLARLKQP
jgi:cell division protein FtsI/penicillin-binding protein 2